MSVKRKRTSSKGGPTTKRRRYLNYGLYGRFSKKGGEAKYFDTSIATGLSTTGSVRNSINLIPQGVTENTRVGRKCTITKISIRGQVRCGGDTSSGGKTVRIIVFLDKQANGAAAAITDILDSASYKSFNNLANSQRFVTLKDWYFRIEAGGYDGNAFNDYGKTLKWNKRCNIPLEFSGTSGAITELRSNNIGVLSILESDEGSTGIDVFTRVRFTDQ